MPQYFNRRVSSSVTLGLSLPVNEAILALTGVTGCDLSTIMCCIYLVPAAVDFNLDDSKPRLELA